MRIAIILDPLEHIKTYKDSTFAIMREAARRGHVLHVMEQQDVWLEAHRVLSRSCRLTMVDDALRWYTLGEPEIKPLDAFDVVLMRKDPPFDMEYVYSTHLLELAEEQGAHILNRPAAIRDYNEKLAIARFPEFIAPTLVSRDMERLRAFIREQGEAVVKPLNAMGGSGVFRVTAGDVNLNVILETMTRLGTCTVMAQRFVPEIREGDKRILLIDGEPVPYALARIPREGEFRGNLAAGGRGVAQPLSPRDREIAESLGPRLKAEGLFLVGLDVIGDHLTEINVTSPTGMQEITAQTGFDVAAMFLDALERRVEGRG